MAKARLDFGTLLITVSTPASERGGGARESALRHRGGSNRPKLRESAFHPGAEPSLFILEVGSRYEALNEHYRVLPNEPKWREKDHALEGAAVP